MPKLALNLKLTLAATFQTPVLHSEATVTPPHMLTPIVRVMQKGAG